MTRWEYGVEEFSMADRWTRKKQHEEMARLHAKLNEWGAQGWELISYESIPMYGSWSSKLAGYAYLLLFKRPAT